MPLTTIPIPYGLRDVKLVGFTTPAATAYNTPTVDLPYARTFSFSETEDFEDLRGDDVVVTTRGSGPGVDWELEGGAVSLEAVQVMYGGTITSTGTTPAQKKVLSKKQTDSRPYFKAEGQVISDSGGDLHAVVYKCRATGDLDGEFGDGEYFLTGASGRGIGSTVVADVDKVWDFVQNETAVANT